MSHDENIFPRDANMSLNKDAAERLAYVMSAISEEYYCAGWLIDLEFSLWEMLQGGSRRFGLGEVSTEELGLLRRLHEECGGWVVWGDVGEGHMGETFVPTDKWLTMVAAEEKR